MAARLQHADQPFPFKPIPSDQQGVPAFAEQVGSQPGPRDGDAQPELPSAHAQQFDPESIPFNQVIGEHGRDGVDYRRICALHEWASHPVVSGSLALGQRCPFCAGEIEGGRKRYFELNDRLFGAGR